MISSSFQCEVRRAVPREQAQDNAPYDTVSQPGKAFVGGLSDDITEGGLVVDALS